jgi:ATP-dependent DNA ligase
MAVLLRIRPIKHDGYRLIGRLEGGRVRLFTRRGSGIRISEHIEEDGATVFRHACKLGCEGIVSKQSASPYRSGRVRTWIKVKNPESPAMTRVWER